MLKKVTTKLSTPWGEKEVPSFWWSQEFESAIFTQILAFTYIAYGRERADRSRLAYTCDRGESTQSCMAVFIDVSLLSNRCVVSNEEGKA
jgi:hypothetical protein